MGRANVLDAARPLPGGVHDLHRTGPRRRPDRANIRTHTPTLVRTPTHATPAIPTTTSPQATQPPHNEPSQGYLHEALEVVAQRSPEIADVLDRLGRDREPFVCLDGTLVRTDRVAARTQASNHLWYSGKDRAFGGNVQVLTDHTGFPVWTAPVEPGSTHDITAARPHALPALYRAASLGLPTLADKGYTGAGIGIKVPAKNPHPDPDTRWRNELISSMRAPAERANALIKHFKALKHVTLDPRAITTIAAAALVILTLHKGIW